MTEHTAGPWAFRTRKAGRVLELKREHWEVGHPNGFGVAIVFGENDSNARLIAATTDLFEAALRLEMAELAHANCEECGDTPELAPECCAVCFPLFDDARVMRRNAIAKARGTSLTSAQRHSED